MNTREINVVESTGNPVTIQDFQRITQDIQLLNAITTGAVGSTPIFLSGFAKTAGTIGAGILAFNGRLYTMETSSSFISATSVLVVGTEPDLNSQRNPETGNPYYFYTNSYARVRDASTGNEPQADEIILGYIAGLDTTNITLKHLYDLINAEVEDTEIIFSAYLSNTGSSTITSIKNASGLYFVTASGTVVGSNLVFDILDPMSRFSAQNINTIQLSIIEDSNPPQYKNISMLGASGGIRIYMVNNPDATIQSMRVNIRMLVL